MSAAYLYFFYREEKYIEAVECLIAAANGTVTYSGNSYDEPCDEKLVKQTSLFVFDSAMTDLLIAYEFMCSPHHVSVDLLAIACCLT